MALQTYNIQLRANEHTMQFFSSMLEEHCNVYNECADIIRDNNTPLTLKHVHKEVYRKLRETHPTLPAQTIIKTYKAVMAAFRSIRSNQHENAETPRKKQLSLVLDKRLYSRFDVTGISLSGEVPYKHTRYGFVMYDKAEEMFSRYRTKDPTLFIRNGKLWLAVPFVVPDQPVTSEKATGVDLGCKRLFVTSDGVAFRDKQYLANRRKIRYLRSCLNKRGTKSARRHLRKISRRESNLSRDMQYRAVNHLLRSTDAGILVLEDLSKIKKSTVKSAAGHKRKRHNNRLSQVPFYGFRIKLEAKAPLFGKKVVTVCPAFTSQKDSRTGKKDGTRKGCRYYCKDGMVLDADWNAAVNIAKKGKHPLSNVLPVDGGLLFLSGRAVSTSHTCVNPDGVRPDGSHKPTTSVVGS